MRKSFMVALVMVASTSLFTVSSRASERRVLTATFSPDKRTVIVEEDSGHGEHAGEDFYFEETSSHKKLGPVLPPAQRGPDGVTKVAVVSSWSPDGSKVALLVFYGTKRSELLLCARDGARWFRRVAVEVPDTEAVYQRRTKHEQAEMNSGPDENAVGPWLDENTVRLISGQKWESGGRGPDRHIFISFTAHLRGSRASVSDVDFHGPLSDAAGNQFIEKWGARYFEDTDGN